MATIGRRDLLLLLFAVKSKSDLTEGINGITRLQKYVYLLEKEEGILPGENGFEFVPYKAGPYSAKLYDDLEFLENLGLIESEVTSDATDEESAEIAFQESLEAGEERFEFKQRQGSDTPDAYEERRYRLTPEGLKHVKRILSAPAYAPFVEGVRKIKSKFGTYSLQDLLYYVYTKYPNMTTESEIRDRVLRRKAKK
jgi:uncharacterized protein YwgA